MSTVVLLGPSAGADVAIVEAGTYRDVDGVIVCFHTARLQPALSEVDVGSWFSQGDYFDFGTDFRTRFFYAQPWALDSIINLDNTTRQLVPRAEIQSALSDASAPFRAQIDVPVLLMQADHDGLFVPQNDTALFSRSPDVSFVLLRKAGHKAFCIPPARPRPSRPSHAGSTSDSRIESRCQLAGLGGWPSRRLTSDADSQVPQLQAATGYITLRRRIGT